MKAPSGELLFYAALLLGGALYVAIRLPTTAAEFQAVAVALAACLAAEAVLLLVRFRWSPEAFVVIFVFVLGWGVVRGATDGFTGGRIGMTAGAVGALFAYPVLRREVRGRAAERVVRPGRDEGGSTADGPLDWTKLPPGLSYLAEPAAEYGEIQFDNRIMDFLERDATAADRKALRALKPLVRRDEDAINSWIDELGITEHREAALVYFLLHLMVLGNDAGLL